MMHSTLDILLTSDPGSGTDMTGEWESQCEERNSPRIKFPLKMIDDSVNSVNLNFTEPEIGEPVDKKSEPKKNSVTVVNISSKNKKGKKSNLF